MNLQEVGWGGMTWNELVKDRAKMWAVLNAVMSFQIPKIAGNFIIYCTYVYKYKRTFVHLYTHSLRT